MSGPGLKQSMHLSARVGIETGQYRRAVLRQGPIEVNMPFEVNMPY